MEARGRRAPYLSVAISVDAPEDVGEQEWAAGEVEVRAHALHELVVVDDPLGGTVDVEESQHVRDGRRLFAA